MSLLGKKLITKEERKKKVFASNNNFVKIEPNYSKFHFLQKKVKTADLKKYTEKVDILFLFSAKNNQKKMRDLLRNKIF